MEVVGGIASIWAILDATKTIHDFLKGLYDANEDRLKIVRELYSCTRALEGIYSIGIDNAEKLHNLNALSASGSLEQYKRTVDDLASRVIEAKGRKDVTKGFQFVISHTTVQKLLLELERHKNTFQMCLGADNLYAHTFEALVDLRFQREAGKFSYSLTQKWKAWSLNSTCCFGD